MLRVLSGKNPRLTLRKMMRLMTWKQDIVFCDDDSDFVDMRVCFYMPPQRWRKK